ncbi:MAG: HlyD family efflux transporter periplasmic adaptor subunit [Lewinellaceae bacterium]|nr:HlyD family efflux transporter periplasmic adaptor subunit [Lewinellaceae bacterium]
MEEREYVELRSEEVQEILGTPPGWLIRWGTFVVFIGVTALLGVAAIISYPDVVVARITITPKAPPVDVIARTDGHIANLFVRDTFFVQEGSVLAVLQSTGRYEDIKRLERAMNYWFQCIPDSLNNILPLEGLETGELQAEYAAFVQAMDNYRFGKQDKSSSVQRSIEAIKAQANKLEQSIVADQKAMRRIQTQLASARELYQRQRDLFDAGAIARNELEKERQRLDDIERQYEAIEDNIIRKQNEITSLGRSRNDAALGEAEGEQSAAGRVRQTLSDLKSALDKWKQTYLITAPTAGRVSFNANVLFEKQYVRQDQQLLVIVPLQKDMMVGRLLLPIANSGKVQPKQQVIIKLDSYPYAEFGTLRGGVLSKSLTPKDDKYSVVVYLPEGLTTHYGKTLPFRQRLEGTAEIITDEKRFCGAFMSKFLPRDADFEPFHFLSKRV